MRFIDRLTLIAAFIAVATTNAAKAQTSSFDVPETGMRIRVSRIGATPSTGTVLARTGDGIVVGWANGSRDTVAMNDVLKLEVSEGRTRHVGRGALIGSGVGAVIGILAKVSADHDARDTRDQVCTETGAVGCLFGTIATGSVSATTWVMIPVSTLVGTGIGALFGSVETEQWRESKSRRTATRVGLVPMPSSRRVALAISAHF